MYFCKKHDCSVSLMSMYPVVSTIVNYCKLISYKSWECFFYQLHGLEGWSTKSLSLRTGSSAILFSHLLSLGPGRLEWMLRGIFILKNVPVAFCWLCYLFSIIEIYNKVQQQLKQVSIPGIRKQNAQQEYEPSSGGYWLHCCTSTDYLIS